MKAITVSSPAKLNLYLSVLGKRRDGYHKLLTLFHRISLCDTLRLEKKVHGFSLTSNLPQLPSDGRNLITKAFYLLREYYPEIGGVRVSLKKRIPLGAGLGGGSSNAASFLMAMNRLYRLRASRRRLLEIGRCLGADVPFFLYKTNQAIASGRGDVIKIRRSKRKLWFLLVIDPKELSTKKVYEISG